MADQDLLTAEPDLGAVMAAAGAPQGAAPEAPAMPSGEELAGLAPTGAPEEPNLESLLASINQSEEPPAPMAEPEPSAADLASLLTKMRAGAMQNQATEEQEVDALSARFQRLEQQMNKLNLEKQALASQNTRDNIQSAIQGSIVEQLHNFQIDPKDPEGEAFTKLVTHSAMVAVAREQARTGSNDVDLKSVSKTVDMYSKLAVRFGRALSAISKSQRRGPAGSQKQPFTPSKAPGDMNDDEFDAAVMAAFKSLS